MSKSNYLENLIINAMRGTGITAPAQMYVALFSTDPAEDASGTELSGNGYARQAITLIAPTDGVSSNSAIITYSPSGGDWTAATHAAIFDASSAGNMWYYEALNDTRTGLDGVDLTFAIGALTVTET